MLRLRGRRGEAAAACDAVIARHPGCVPALVLAIELADDDARARTLLRDVRAYCAYSDARVDELSLDALEAARGLEPALRRAAKRAPRWFNAMAYPQIEQELERLADRNAEVTPAWRRLIGLWLYARAQGSSWHLAEDAARTVLAIDPELVSAYDALAYVYGKQGRTKRAHQAFARAELPRLLAVHGEPGDFDAWIARAPGAALSPFAQTSTERRAEIEAGPRDLAAMLGHLHPEAARVAPLVDWDQLGRTRRQAFLFAAHVCAYEHPGGWAATLAERLLRRGQLLACARVFDLALAIAEEAGVGPADRGRMLAVQGGALIAVDPRRARQVFEEAERLIDVEREPELGAVLHLNFAALCMDLNDLEQAERRFAEAVKLAPTAHQWIETVNSQRFLLDLARGANANALSKIRGLEQRATHPQQRGAVVAARGLVHYVARRFARAREAFADARSLLREVDPRVAARVACFQLVLDPPRDRQELPRAFAAAAAELERYGDRHGLVIVAACRHLTLGEPAPDLALGPIEARLVLRAGKRRTPKRP